MIRNGSHGVILCDWHLITTFASLLFKIHHAIYEQTNSKDHVSVLISLLMEHSRLTDTAYLGRVGEVELGASALAGVYYLVIYMLGFGFSVGAQVLMARRNGEGEYKRIGEVFTQGGLFLFLLAAVLFTASNLLTPYLLHRMIGSEEVYRATMSYLDWRVYGFFFSFIAVMFRAFYVSTTNTKILTANSVVMVLTNVVLNYILIFGKFGFPALGDSRCRYRLPRSRKLFPYCSS